MAEIPALLFSIAVALCGGFLMLFFGFLWFDDYYGPRFRAVLALLVRLVFLIFWIWVSVVYLKTCVF